MIPLFSNPTWWPFLFFFQMRASICANFFLFFPVGASVPFGFESHIFLSSLLSFFFEPAFPARFLSELVPL